MIDVFESSVRIHPDQVFFTFVDDSGIGVSYTYRHARLISAALARKLQSLGARPGEAVIVDLPNCPEYIFLILACAYADLTLVVVNHTLSRSEKLGRIMELERDGMRVATHVDEERAWQLTPGIRRAISDESSVIASIYGRPSHERAIMGEREDIVHDTVHFAERAAHLFNGNAHVGVVFASGGVGRARLVPLMWSQLVGASVAANQELMEGGQKAWQAKLPMSSVGASGVSAGAAMGASAGAAVGLQSVASVGAAAGVPANVQPGSPNPLTRDTQAVKPKAIWQCALPLYHIDGFQVLVRSVVGQNPFRLYATFDPELVLHDGEICAATHVCVRNDMLQDLLTVEEWRCELLTGSVSRLAGYQCILLCNRSLEARTLKRAIDMGARVFASYGMTETSGLIATSLVRPDFSGGLKLCSGYDVRIVDPSSQGFGNLTVSGPGIFDGYVNANAAFTVDRYFITGDTAALFEGSIYVKSRSADMFVSGGENIYPSEIAEALRHVPGVHAAHVFGVEDTRLGNVPVAVVECTDPALTSEGVIATVRPWLAAKSVPASIMLVDRIPRTESGKIDRVAAEALFDDRLQIVRIVLHHVKVPFTEPVRNIYGEHRSRESVIVEVVDIAGRVGLGECVALGEEWGYAEGLPEDTLYIKETLAPELIGSTVRHPRDISAALDQLPGSAEHPMAVAALENAAWDLYGQVVGRPMWQLINEEYERQWAALGLSEYYEMLPRVAQTDGNQALVATGDVIGLAPTPQVMESVAEAMQAGCRRLSIKIAPGMGLATAQAVRRAFPELLITLDAERTFTETSVDELRAYDSLNIGWIEEPFDFSGASTQSRRDPVANLAAAQQMMATPFCVDESYASAAEADRVLQFNDLHCIAVKPAKLGGITPTLAFIAKAKVLGKVVWMSSMYDFGISRRVSAAFETLPDMVIPGDVDSVLRYFDTDVTTPPYGATRGLVLLNGEGHEAGLGCSLDLAALARVEQNCLTIE